MTWSRAVDDAKPIVESMIGGCRIIAILDRHAEVPLAKVSGGIAVLFEHFGNRSFTLQKVHSVKTLVEDGVDSGSWVLTAGQKGGARRRASRSSRVKVGEAHTSGGQLVEDGSFHRTAVASDVAITEVIDEKGDDVRTLCRREQAGGKREGGKECEKVFHELIGLA